MTYDDFVRSKFNERQAVESRPLNNPGSLFDWQQRIVEQALERNRSAIFAECGLGKTAMQLKFAEHVPGRVLILAPLAVGQQTVQESQKFGIEDVAFSKYPIDSRIVVTNYENLRNFEGIRWNGIVLDESSILKGFDGKTSSYIIAFSGLIPWRLACTATPAPNDWTELAMHSEFVGNLRRNEMFGRFFVNDMGLPGSAKWRLKKHAKDLFWEWVRTWSSIAKMPSDFGGDDTAFVLPEKRVQVSTTESKNEDMGMLFSMPVSTLTERRSARKSSLGDRCAKAASMVNGKPAVVWVGLNAEHEEVLQRLAERNVDAVGIKGADKPEDKEERLSGFASGKYQVLVTKPSIAGFGLNWQHCAHQIFVGIDDSFERYYQAVRRSWRFGQKSDVTIDIIISEAEMPVLNNILRKEKEHARLMGD